MDDNIKTLVAVMNSLPGLYTYASCGGHSQPNKNEWKGQCEQGSWTVSFDFEEEMNSETLGILAKAASFFADVKILAWDGGFPDDPPCLSWQIDGKGVEPDEFAQCLTYCKGRPWMTQS